jgi:Zn-dependent M28 family amino/carboxypeptidase
VQLRSETVLYVAHWDQLGIGPEVNGDGIYNGAVDNATGVAILLEVARAWASLKTRPARSAVFLATTAGESGLLGWQHYAGHPAAPLAKTAVTINFDTYDPLGIPEFLDVGAAEDTPVWQQAQDAARRLRIRIQTSTAPAFSVRMAGGFAGKDGAWLEALRAKNAYDQPNDEYRDEWDFSGLALVGEYGFLLGRMIADLPEFPSSAN